MAPPGRYVSRRLSDVVPPNTQCISAQRYPLPCKCTTAPMSYSRMQRFGTSPCSSPETARRTLAARCGFSFADSLCLRQLRCTPLTSKYTEAFHSRPYSFVNSRWGQTSVLPSALAGVYSNEYPSRRTSTSRCIRRQAVNQTTIDEIAAEELNSSSHLAQNGKSWIYHVIHSANATPKTLFAFGDALRAREFKKRVFAEFDVSAIHHNKQT